MLNVCILSSLHRCNSHNFRQLRFNDVALISAPTLNEISETITAQLIRHRFKLAYSFSLGPSQYCCKNRTKKKPQRSEPLAKGMAWSWAYVSQYAWQLHVYMLKCKVRLAVSRNGRGMQKKQLVNYNQAHRPGCAVWRLSLVKMSCFARFRYKVQITSGLYTRGLQLALRQRLLKLFKADDEAEASGYSCGYKTQAQAWQQRLLQCIATMHMWSARWTQQHPLTFYKQQSKH